MEEALKFNEWMKKIHSIHFANTKRMLIAYEKFTEKTEEEETKLVKQLCTQEQ